MRQLVIILAFGFNSILTFGQEKTSPLHQFDLHFNMGFGSKSHFGNFGLTSSFFLFKNLNLTLSGGVGAMNYNGAIVSIGPELCLPTSKSTFIYLGSVWTKAGKNQDILGDDDSPDHVWYFTDKSDYIRTFLGLSIGKDALTKIEIGYSHCVNTPNYSFGGPSVATSKQISDIEKGLSSGLLISIMVGGIFESKRKNK